MLTVSVPPFIQQLRPWWWAFVSILAAAALLFLLLQLLAGFSLVNKVRQSADNDLAAQTKDCPTQCQEVA